MRSMIALLLFAFSYATGAPSGGEDAPPDAAEKIRPLLIGARVPKLTLTTLAGEPFDLNAAVAKQPTVLIFYRGNW